MKEIDELNLPADLSYSDDHEWVQKTGETVKIGISDYAQDQLGDIVFVEMPEVGDTFAKGDEFGTLESVKAVSEMFVPLSGEVVAVNDALEDAPELINEDPYVSWIIEIRPTEANEYDELLSRDDYLKLLQG
ncbi:MAG: glycine cleavage system protein GcvH [Thermodesulfobacteriota bacterium]|nr:glycine cleavage system protein GcvH [Thermodesulfobacteriota bacterium]